MFQIALGLQRKTLIRPHPFQQFLFDLWIDGCCSEGSADDVQQWPRFHIYCIFTAFDLHFIAQFNYISFLTYWSSYSLYINCKINVKFPFSYWDFFFFFYNSVGGQGFGAVLTFRV